MNGNDNGFIENREKEKQRQKNIIEYQRKFLNKKWVKDYYERKVENGN